MYFSTAAVVALWCQCTLAALVAEDIGDCAALPKEETSLGQRAMLQQSAKPLKEDVPTVIDIDDSEKEPLKTKSLGKPSTADIFIDIDDAEKEPLQNGLTVMAIDSMEKLPLKKGRKTKHVDILEPGKRPKGDSLTVIDIEDTDKEPLEKGQAVNDILNIPKSGMPSQGDSLTVIDIDDSTKEPLGKNLDVVDIDDLEKEPVERGSTVQDILNSMRSAKDLQEVASTVFDIDDSEKEPLGKNPMVLDIDDSEKEPLDQPDLDKTPVVLDIEDFEKEPLKNHDLTPAMLQQSAKPSKGDVLTIENAAPPTDSMVLPTLTGEASLQAASVDPLMQPVPTAFDVDSTETKLPEKGSIAASVLPEMEEQEVFLANPVPTDSISSPVDENVLQNQASLPAQPAAQQEFLAEACDWQCYLNRYPDLLSVVGANNVAAAEQHWNTVGKSEGRDCTCAAGESLAVVDEAASNVELDSQLKASANVMDAVTSCQPLSPEAQAEMEAEIKDYEASEKFQEKMLEAEGKSPASAGHVAIMKYLREKVLKPGLSVLELGCGAGGMLRFIEDEYNIGWGGGYYAKAVPHGSLVGVELVPGWVQFAQEHFKNISVYQGDITEYSLPEPYASEKFDLVMLNDVMEHVQKTRYGCFFSQLDKVTSAGSLVYMHTPSPMAQLEEKKLLSETSTQSNENVVPHHFVVTGMASIGFELLSFEHDMDTVCGGEAQNLPKQLQGAHCYYNGWPKYTHNVFRKVHDPAVMNMS